MSFSKPYNGSRVWNPEFQSDAEGKVKFETSSRLDSLRYWVEKPSFVGEYISFDLDKYDDKKLIPDRFEFRLAKGTELGGKVVDESGQPVSGVKVFVNAHSDVSDWNVNPDPRIWVSESGTTDDEGKWKINSAPARKSPQDFEFGLKFSHPDYASDLEFGELQREQNLTTDLLRNGTAKLVLSQGIRLRGVVVDSAGNSVTAGSLLWQDDPMGDAKKFEAKFDEEGRFETAPLFPGYYTSTIIAPGFQPQRQTISVTPAMSDIPFTLQPGKHLIVKVVDSDGKPIPKAQFQIASWRTMNSAIIFGPSNVFEGRFPTHADDQGIYRWDGAPADSVTYRIQARGVFPTKVTLIANDAEHIVQLKPLLVASGRVIDAITREPVEKFNVVPVTVFRPKNLSTDFQNPVVSQDGKYEITFWNSSDHGYRYRVRIDADGYRTAIGEKSFDSSDGRVTQDFALEPAAARTGTVVDGQGKPVASAIVFEGTPSDVPHIFNNELGLQYRRVVTSSEGEFQLAATFEPIRIRVHHQSGFAEVLRQPDEALGTITLQPWAKISGTLLQDGKPVPESIGFISLSCQRRQLGSRDFRIRITVQTDSKGRFEFDRLPPITGSLRAHLGPGKIRH